MAKLICPYCGESLINEFLVDSEGLKEWDDYAKGLLSAIQTYIGEVYENNLNMKEDVLELLDISYEKYNCVEQLKESINIINKEAKKVQEIINQIKKGKL